MALSSCHMLSFLAIAARKRLTVDSYEDEAVGHMEKNAEGRIAITRVELRPRVRFSGANPPSAGRAAQAARAGAPRLLHRELGEDGGHGHSAETDRDAPPRDRELERLRRGHDRDRLADPGRARDRAPARRRRARRRGQGARVLPLRARRDRALAPTPATTRCRVGRARCSPRGPASASRRAICSRRSCARPGFPPASATRSCAAARTSPAPSCTASTACTSRASGAGSGSTRAATAPGLDAQFSTRRAQPRGARRVGLPEGLHAAGAGRGRPALAQLEPRQDRRPHPGGAARRDAPYRPLNAGFRFSMNARTPSR